VIVLAAHAGGERVAAQGGAHARDLVGGHGHADTRAAHENTAIDLAYRDGFAYLLRIVGIVHGVGRVSTEVEDLVLTFEEPALERFLELPAGVIGP
jgi:hypothetical protein